MQKHERRATQKVNPAPAADTYHATPTVLPLDVSKRVADQVDWSLWAAIYEGKFRLAVPCRRCGRWLVDGRSKRRHYGPRCAALAAEAVTA
jgi:hypothetical protein